MNRPAKLQRDNLQLLNAVTRRYMGARKPTTTLIGNTTALYDSVDRWYRTNTRVENRQMAAALPDVNLDEIAPRCIYGDRDAAVAAITYQAQFLHEQRMIARARPKRSRRRRPCVRRSTSARQMQPSRA